MENYGRLLCALQNEEIVQFSVEKLPSTNGTKLYRYTLGDVIEFTATVGQQDFLFHTDIVEVKRLDLSGLDFNDVFIKKVQNSAENMAKEANFAKHLPPLTWDNLSRKDCEWRVVHGHPFHPLNKLRWPQLPGMSFGKCLSLPVFKVPRSQAQVFGNYDAVQREKILDKENLDLENYVYIPMHPDQLVLLDHGQWELIDTKISAFSQCNVRTVTCLPESTGYDMKLPLSVQMTSIVRDIPFYAVYNGVAMTTRLRQIEEGANNFIKTHLGSDLVFKIFYEVGSAFVNKQVGCIIRKVPVLRPGEILLPVAFLVDTLPHSKSFNLLRLLGADDAKVFLRLVIWTFLYILIQHRCAMEFHGQNLQIVVNVRLRQVVGIAYRDFGGIAILDGDWNEVAASSIILQREPNKEGVISNFLHDLYTHLIVLQRSRIIPDFRAFIQAEIDKCFEKLPKNDYSALLAQLISSPCIPMKSLARMGIFSKEEPTFHFVPNILSPSLNDDDTNNEQT